MSPPTTRWRGFPTTCTRCRPRSTSCRAPTATAIRFAMLEQRIAALTSTLESRERPASSENTEHLESALRALSDRLDRMPVGNDSASAFAHLEQRVSYLLERLESSSRSPRRQWQSRPGRGRRCRTSCAISKASMRTLPRWPRTAASRGAAAAMRPRHRSIIVKRELSDIRFSQSETDRHTQDSLEAVHNTLGHVVDRLAMIEGDLRDVRAAAGRAAAGRRRQRLNPLRRRPQHRASRCRRSRNPNCRIPPRHRSISPPRRANSTSQHSPVAHPMPRSRRAAAAVAPRAISEILEPHAAAARRDRTGSAARSSARAGDTAERDARLRRRSASRLRKARSAKFRRARANRSAPRVSLPPRAAPPRPPPPRRQRQGRSRRGQAARRRQGQDANKEPSTITSKIRSLLVGASVVVIVLGTFKMAMTLLDAGSAPPMPAMEEFERAAALGSTARR